MKITVNFKYASKGRRKLFNGILVHKFVLLVIINLLDIRNRLNCLNKGVAQK